MKNGIIIFILFIFTLSFCGAVTAHEGHSHSPEEVVSNESKDQITTSSSSNFFWITIILVVGLLGMVGFFFKDNLLKK